MKKKSIVLIILIAIIVIIALFIKGKVHSNKIEYKITEINEYKYLKYKNKDDYGIIDRDGKVIIEAKYKKIEVPNPEKDVFICYNTDDESEVINSKNEKIFKEYEKIEPIKLKNIASLLCFEKSILKYKKGDTYGLVDFEEKEITSNEYDSIENLLSTEGKFLVSKNDKYGIINMNGAILVKTEYDKIETDKYYGDETEYTKEGFIVSNKTKEGYRCGYIDYMGNKVLNADYNEIVRISTKDLYLIVSRNGKYGLYKGKKQIIKPDYNSIIYTDNGALIIEKNNQFGIANLDGKIKVGTKYSQIDENGIYLYAQNEIENDVYTPEGERADISYSKSVYETENEKYRISTIINNDVTYYGIENKQGDILVANNYSFIEYAFGDYFIVVDKDEKYGVIDGNGKEYIAIKYDLIQKIKEKNILQISSRKNKETIMYSWKMEEVTKMKSATVQNENNYVEIYNGKEKVFLDKDGKIIEETSEIIQNDIKKKIPEKIGDYKKKQDTLDDAYYEK